MQDEAEPQSAAPTMFTEAQFRNALSDMNVEEEPRSRFSATTYATTAPPDSVENTPRPSFEPEVPPLPDSILNRRRPVPSADGYNAMRVARKPTSSEAGSMYGENASIRSKRLPVSPPEKQPVDRIAGLRAKIEDLKRRHENLQTVIRELSNVVQPSSKGYDLNSRGEIKKTVDSLERELADVMKEEHETGLKLHRALKKRDDAALYEPTGLWVRRVTR